jgi:ribosomal protein L31E
MAQQKQYYFYRLTLNGRTYYNNQDDKRVSAAKVKQSKRKVYDLVQKSVPYTDIKAGDLLDRRKAKAVKYTKEITAQQFSKNNVLIQREINNAIESGSRIFSQIGNKIVEHKSKASKGNLLLFNYELQEKFYNNLKKLTDSPFFNIEMKFSPKDNIYFFDWNSLQLDDNLNASAQILKGFKKFNQDKDDLNKKYFK